MKKEFKLSDKIGWSGPMDWEPIIRIKDIKEFIKRLKEDLMNDIDLKKHKTIIEVKIDKLVGEDLK